MKYPLFKRGDIAYLTDEGMRYIAPYAPYLSDRVLILSRLSRQRGHPPTYSLELGGRQLFISARFLTKNLTTPKKKRI